jgi:3-hydroxyisobutyrate dehydrogenase-like beta-hydroxyacid dehydrogenase
MGGPLAARVLAAGHALVVFDTREAAMAPLVARGARRAESAAAVAARAERVLVSLPTPEVVRQVAIGEGGIAGGGAVRTFVDLSTTGPRVAQVIARVLAARGITAVDAPVSGGVRGAEQGTLAVMVSGPREHAEAVRPALEAIGRVFYLGERPGLGQTMKLANNLLSATAMAISAEAMVMGVKAGLDPRLMLEVINAGSGRNTATQDKFPRAVLPRTFDYGFAMGLMFKDVRLCLEEAEALGVPMWVGSAVRQLWGLGVSRLGADADFTSIVRCIEEWAGVEVRATS